VKEYYVNIKPVYEDDTSLFFDTSSMMGVINNPDNVPFEVIITKSELSGGDLSTEIGVQNNTRDNANPLVFIALYDGNNRLVSITKDNVYVLEGKSVFKSFTMSVDRPLESYTQKVFLWNSLTDIEPLAKHAEYY
jgi:hypothetical protein